MKTDIILSGVGGQGILSIATVIGEAATESGLYLKQAEVHGMSQRGGDVQSNLRLSTDTIYSDLIPLGQADLIISMEPMEALRYVPYLSQNGRIVTSSRPLVNIPSYPDSNQLMSALESVNGTIHADIDELAKGIQAPKSANMILLGMAATLIEFIPADVLRKAIECVFASKGEKIVADNIKCFNLGLDIYENF